MSRRARGLDGHTVVVGWDPPLQTFFGQVYDPNVFEDDNPIIWVGVDRRLWSISELAQALGEPWRSVVDDADMGLQLQADCEGDVA